MCADQTASRTLSNKNIRFWDKWAERYAAKPIDDMPAYEAKLDSVRSYLSIEDRVLEIGCGTGGTAIRLAPFVSEWIGADFSSEMVRIANAKRKPSNVRFVIKDAEAEIEGAPFDVICAFSLLHLTPDLSRTLSVIGKQMKPGGLFISNTVCVGDQGLHMKVFLRVVQFFLGLKTVHILTKDALVNMISEAGFEIEECRYLSKKSVSPYIVARRK